ncbi:class I poly(R)-hydroxyalkanoic acid synthase [Sphingobium sp. LMA1-1-1.1]|uniref:PHA/PHB synthase family protein n=1 Tax=Sphingobium sp. LMA1-1-1.1 TaxID=3135238 RepID=UPI00343E2CB1
MKEQDVMEPHLPTLQDMQQWTQVLGRAQQLLLEQAAGAAGRTLPFDPEAVARIQTSFADEGLALWQRFLTSGGLLRDQPKPPPSGSPAAARDRRFADPAWTEHPFYDLIRQSYLLLSDYLMRMADAVDGVDPRQKAKLRFATTGLLDAIAPSNFPLTNPMVVQRTIQSGGENLVKGLKHMLADLEKGQLSHTDGTAFEVGRNIASTPGKVIKETPLYQLIHYAPTTGTVMETPLLIFPPWINRFYILDLSPEKSFVKWAVDQGLSVFLVSWKSADGSMKDLVWDDYILNGQLDAIDTVRDLLDVPSVHTIGYCVAGTTLAATLALLAARGEADKVASATFFTAQVDFSKAGDLALFVDDEQMKMVEQLSSGGFLDGRYMAATFNLLRGRDLIWNYVVNNYLLGQDYPPFDLLYWNGDTTNLPARWHKDYLTQLYRDNLLVQPGAISVAGTPIDLRQVRTPAYVQAGREDHIAPLESVWKLTEHFSGPIRFLLAGSGHIAGVVNPPAAGKYQYWSCDESQPTLEAFLAQARETRGSWWPDWIEWIRGQTPATVPVKGARRPGKGRLKAIEDAPGRYVKSR